MKKNLSLKEQENTKKLVPVQRKVANIPLKKEFKVK